MGNVKRQGGSVAGFIVIGTILVLVSFGALYGMKHIAMRDQSPPMALPGLASNDIGKSDEANDPSKEDAPGGTTDEQGANGTNPSRSEDKPAAPGAQPKPQSGGAGSDLPQSGPSEDIMSMVALSAVTASGFAYAGSLRRH